MKIVLLVVAAVLQVASTAAATATCDAGCQEIYKPVCGSDGNTYENQCSFEYAKCLTQNDSLTVVSNGICPTKKDDCSKKGACMAIFAPVCGSDGNTYSNKCELETAQCKSKDLTLASDGECTGASKSDSKADKCTNTMCTQEFAPVCGSNGKTYSNKCKLDSEACTDTTLTLVGTGPCSTASSQAQDNLGAGNEAGSLSKDKGSKDSSDDGSESGCEESICTQEIASVCGSDGKTYNNLCKLRNAACSSPGLTKKADGKCTDGTVPPVTNMTSSLVPTIALIVLSVAAAILG